LALQKPRRREVNRALAKKRPHCLQSPRPPVAFLPADQREKIRVRFFSLCENISARPQRNWHIGC
jgi:hypothetical protein